MIPVVLLVASLFGCSSDADDAALAKETTSAATPTPTKTTAKPKPTRTTPSPSPTPTPSDVPKISVEAACQIYVDDDLLTRAIVPITALVEHADGSTLDIPGAEGIIEELRDLAAQSPPVLGRQLELMASVTDEIVDAYSTGVNSTIRTGDWRTASIDVITQCGEAMGT